MDSPERMEGTSTVPTPIGFYSQKFGTLEHWFAWSDFGLALLAPQASFLIFIQHTWRWDCCSAGCHHCLTATTPSPPRPVLHLCPTYLSRWIWLLQILVCWTSIQFNFLRVRGVLCFVSCDSSYGCARRQSMSPCASLLTGSPVFLFLYRISERDGL